MPGGGLPWQVRAFAGGGQDRIFWYKVAMASGLGATAYWWWSSGKEIEKRQEEAVEKFGKHGEKVEYGDKNFKQNVTGDHFPGIPAATTNAAGGHPGGTRPGPS